jgi:energy-coupling factor transport system permease protein
MGMARRAAKAALFYAFLAGVLRLCALFPGIISALISFTVIHIQKIFPVFLFASGFITTTKVSHLMCAMQKLYIPKYIVIPLTVALRFFPTARDDFSRIKDAMRLRGLAASPSNILRHPLMVLERALIPLMLRSANIAEELSVAAVARGIETERPRTSLWELRFTRQDFIIVFLFGVLTLFTIITALK